MNKEYSLDQIIAYLKTMNGISLLIYYILVIFPNWNTFYSVNSGISPIDFDYYPKSLLFLVWDLDFLKFLITVLTFVLILLYTFGNKSKIIHLIALFGHISLHLANPFIIHEPQQLNNLLFIMLFFFNNNQQSNEKKIMLNIMQIYIGIYYLFAALKKIPDDNWIDGSAVGLICSWTYLQKTNMLNELCQNTYISIILTYITLIFELSFLPISFTKYKKHLIIFGFLFHIGIGLSLHVGLFFWSMIMWYPLLLQRKI